MNAGSINQVVVEGSSGGADAERLRVLLAEVEPGTPRVVEQKSITAARSAGSDEEGDTLVKGIRRLLKVVRIGVPERKRLAATIQRARLVAQTKKMLLIVDL